MRKKSSLVVNGMVAAVLAAVVIIAVITIPNLVGKSAEKIGEETACEKSLMIANGLKTVAGKVVDKSGNPVAVNCPIEFKDVHEENIENPPSGVKNLNRVMSDDVLHCWNRYGDKDDLFDSTTGVYCTPCKVLKMMGEDKFEGLVQYMDSEGYIDKFGAGAIVSQASRTFYDFYSFGGKGKEIAIISTWGKLEGENYLIYNERKDTGLMLYPFDDIGNLDCYSFEGRLNPLKYKR